MSTLQAGAGMPKGAEQAIRSWLRYIGEADQRIVADVLQHCRDDQECRRYFLMRSREVSHG